MKYIIVDNEPLRQRNLRSVLASIGIKSVDVEAFDDVDLALGAVKKKRFDFAFASIVMPKKSGIEFLKEVRESTRTKSLPIVVYGSQPSRETVMEAAEAGANGFLGYPFSVSDVEAVIKKAFAKNAKN